MSNDPVLQFIGIGAARCGTTWLSRCLAEHPAIVFGSRKELHFFNNDHLYRQGPAWLRDQFGPTEPGQLRGEFTPRYLTDLRALHRIQRSFPEAKLIVCLRDPVDRAFSQYRYLRFNRYREPDHDIWRAFEGPNFTDYVLKSRYAEQLRRVHDLFDRDRVHVVTYEALTAGPEAIGDLFEFLGVDRDFVPPSLARRVNESTAEADGPRLLAIAHRQLSLLQPSHRLTARAQWIARDLIMRSSKRLSAMNTDRLPLGHVLSSHEKRRLFDMYFREDVDRLRDEFGIQAPGWGHYDP